MGLLDDAIREHLDLKRRRGADPSEVARLEQEALGPVRREPAPAAEPADEHHDESHAHEPAAAEVEHPHPASEGLHPDDRTHVLPPEDRHESPHGDPLFEQHAHNVEMGGAAAHEREELGGAAASRPEPSAENADRTGAHAESTGPAHSGADPEGEPQDRRHSDIVDQPTTEYQVEDHHDDEHEASAAHGSPDEDVLEETPEFLQETPEHDRLWFEQRPPRDFDFDG
jgi:hypothetical protein